MMHGNKDQENLDGTLARSRSHRPVPDGGELDDDVEVDDSIGVDDSMKVDNSTQIDDGSEIDDSSEKRNERDENERDENEKEETSALFLDIEGLTLHLLGLDLELNGAMLDVSAGRLSPSRLSIEKITTAKEQLGLGGDGDDDGEAEGKLLSQRDGSEDTPSRDFESVSGDEFQGFADELVDVLQRSRSS